MIVERKPVFALLGVSIGLLALRLCAAAAVGFGDSEALYASWAIHPQPAYLDHPGLVGVVARAIGEGAVPSPTRAHVVTALMATLVPWIHFTFAIASGAAPRRAASASIVLALVPEIAVGLFALTPDLLLAPLWLGAVGLAAYGLTAETGEHRSAAALLGAGLLAGIAAAAKVSGFLLMMALAAAYLGATRTTGLPFRRSRAIWPWAGLAAGAVVVLPVLFYEVRTGFPMLRHRFVDTQQGAGLALANVGALAAGQFLYLSPLLFYIAVFVARDLVKHRAEDAISRLLFCAFAIPLLPLLFLCLWSRVAEPHWIAPALLVLPVHAARRPGLVSPRLVRAGAALAATMTLVAHAWVLIPASAQLVPDDVDPKADIASELFGWPQAIASVREQMALAATPYDPEGREVVVVGPHWTICAQLSAALAGVRVGCATPIPDDFDRWLPREEWRHADSVLFVTDARYPGNGSEQLPLHAAVSQSRVRVMRGGRLARTFELHLYAKRSNARR